MILSFSKDKFVADIKRGTKKHTIRTDKTRRWRKGIKIHFWRGSPRNKHAKIKPYSFDEGVCKGIEEIVIKRSSNLLQGFSVTVGGWGLTPEQIETLVKNDGLTIEQFRMWFIPSGTDMFVGRIIHWTDLRYETMYSLPKRDIF